MNATISCDAMGAEAVMAAALPLVFMECPAGEVETWGSLIANGRAWAKSLGGNALSAIPNPSVTA